MSWQATSLVKGMRENLTRTEKFLLLILADYHNDETGQCDPSLDRLAEDTLTSRSQTIRSLKALAKKGFIVIERRREDGKQGSNQYHLPCLQSAVVTLRQSVIQGANQSVIQGATMTPNPLYRTVNKNRKREPQYVDTQFLADRYQRGKAAEEAAV